MPDTPSAANAAPLSNDSARELFEAAFSEYLLARADIYAEHDDESEELTTRRSRRAYAAETALIGTPAPYGWAVLFKWEVVESVLAREVEGGPSKYPLVILGLAALKADVLAIGFAR